MASKSKNVLKMIKASPSKEKDTQSDQEMSEVSAAKQVDDGEAEHQFEDMKRMFSKRYPNPRKCEHEHVYATKHGTWKFWECRDCHIVVDRSWTYESPFYR